MAVSFPSNPIDGQSFDTSSRTYTYSSDKNAWRPVPRTTASDISELTDSTGLLSSGTTTYTDLAALIAATGMSTGDQAFVSSNNILYIYNGTGWYKIATVENLQPTAITGVNLGYTLAQDGTPTVITAVSSDPEGFDLTWSYTVTSGVLGTTATVSQEDNVFTITPGTNDPLDEGTFEITFSVTDGTNSLVSTASTFSLTFALFFAAPGSVVGATEAVYSTAVNTGYRGPAIDKDYNLTFAQYSARNLVKFSVDIATQTVTLESTTAIGLVPTNSYWMALSWNNDGSILYIADTGGSSTTVRAFPCSTPFDPTTIGPYINSSPIYSNSSLCYNMSFSNDGYLMFLQYEADGIYRYTLSTPWDVSTAGSSSDQYITDGSVVSHLSHAGTKLAAVNYSGPSVVEKTLSTPYDLSTASSASSAFSGISNSGAGNIGAVYSPDGNYLFIYSQSSPGHLSIIELA